MATDMPAIAAIEQHRRSLQQQTHRHCYACGAPERGGLGLEFITQADGSVAATWQCPPNYQSYEGILHGGVIATLLDGAMVHALFAQGVVAHTADLHVRYRHPVIIGQEIQITARKDTASGPLHVLSAEIAQNGVVCASARAKFMQASALTPNP